MSSLTLRPSELGECPSITGAIIMLAVLCGCMHYYISLKAVQSCVGCYCTSIDTCFVPQEFKAYYFNGAHPDEVGHISTEECACTEKKEKIYGNLQRKHEK